MKKKIIIGGILLLAIISLGVFFAMPQINEIQKDAYINNFEVFVEEVKERHGDYSKAEWETIGDEYQKLSVQDRLSHEKVLTKEDKKRISALDGEYLAYRTKGYFDQIIESTKKAYDNTIEYTDGLIEGVKNALENNTENE